MSIKLQPYQESATIEKMMLILHGDHTTQIKDYLEQHLQNLKSSPQIVRLDAAGQQLADLEESLGSSDLFGQEKLIILEGLHSLPKSKRKTGLIELLTQPQSTDLILVEKKSLTKTQLKKFPQAEVKEFKISPSIWKFLDTLGSKNKAQKLKLLTQSIQENDEFMVMAMMARHLRLLIQAQEGSAIKGPPFMITKLKKQAQNLPLKKLLAAHAQLLKIDLETKTSVSSLSLQQKLELLLIEQL